MTTDATLQQIYNSLAAGKVLKLQFATAGDAETFRVRLHKYKKVQEDILEAVDLLEAKERLQFKVTPVSTKDLIDGEGGYWEATMRFVPATKVTYRVLEVIECDSTSQSGSE